MILENGELLPPQPKILTPWETGRIIWHCTTDRHLDRFWDHLARYNYGVPSTLSTLRLFSDIKLLAKQDPGITIYSCVKAVFDQLHEASTGTGRQHYVVSPKVVGRIMGIRAIQGAQMVRMAEVDIGRADLLKVVFGDPDLRVDALALVALKGSRILREDKEGASDRLRPRGYTFTNEEGEAVKARSEAMLCSPLEANLRDANLSCNRVSILPEGLGVEPGDLIMNGAPLSHHFSDGHIPPSWYIEHGMMKEAWMASHGLRVIRP